MNGVHNDVLEIQIQEWACRCAIETCMSLLTLNVMSRCKWSYPIQWLHVWHVKTLFTMLCVITWLHILIKFGVILTMIGSGYKQQQCYYLYGNF